MKKEIQSTSSSKEISFNFLKVKKINIYFLAYDKFLLEREIKNFLFYLKKSSIKLKKVSKVVLPTKIKKYSLIKSPFIFKDAKEHYECRIHIRMLVLFLSSNLKLFFFVFKNFILNSGLDIKIKI